MTANVVAARYQSQCRSGLTFGVNLRRHRRGRSRPGFETHLKLSAALGVSLPRPRREAVKALRSLLDDPRVFDAVVVLLATWFLLSAYVVAWAYVIRPQVVVESVSAGLVAVSASWFALTGFLFFAFGRGLGRGRPWNRALPDGHVGTLGAALVFGAAWIADASFWVPFFGRNQIGLEALFSPPHLLEVAAAAVMVSGPLRAAARRGETTASVVTLMSVALLLSVLTFATQFAHPLIDPWAAGAFPYRVQLAGIQLSWVADNLGVASILAQAAILVGTALLLNSAFRLRFGSLTVVFAVNGVFVTITKQSYDLLPVAILTGLAGDVWLSWARRWPGRRGASLGAVIAGSFALLSMVAVAIVAGGLAWNMSLASAVVFASMMLGWLMGRLLPAGLAADAYAGRACRGALDQGPRKHTAAAAGEGGARRPGHTGASRPEPSCPLTRGLARGFGRQRPACAADRRHRRAGRLGLAARRGGRAPAARLLREEGGQPRGDHGAAPPLAPDLL